jgi:hypothetical protein
VLICASCGRDNPAGAGFCNRCGATLASPAPAREVRKTVTVLFCDLTGSTELGEQTDPEALRALLARYFERMKAIVEAHGGTVEKFIGDAVMAVFGIPAAHEDDALRACRAAVEMRDALPGLGIAGGIGVNTGEVVTGTEERLATGDAVNVAARLEQAAAPGEVLSTTTSDRQRRRGASCDIPERWRKPPRLPLSHPNGCDERRSANADRELAADVLGGEGLERVGGAVEFEGVVDMHLQRAVVEQRR